MQAAVTCYLYGGFIQKTEKFVDPKILGRPPGGSGEEEEDQAAKMPYSQAYQMVLDLCIPIKRVHVLVAMNHIGMFCSSRAGQMQCFILWRAAENNQNSG